MDRAGRLFEVLKKSAQADVVAALQDTLHSGPDGALMRVNPLVFAARHGLDDERTIAAFLHAASIGLFDLTWNVLCPGCGGVLDTSASLKSVVQEEYVCALCASGFEPDLDDLVEVTFTVNPGVRRIAAHSPHDLALYDYLRLIYWGSGIDVDEATYPGLMDQIILDALDLQAGEKGVLALPLPEAFLILFEPVTHSVQFIDVKGEPTREKQTLSVIYDRDHTLNQMLTMRPGPLRLAVDNRTDVRVLPALMVAGDLLHDFLAARRPYLTAKRLLTNQTFRDLWRTDTLDIGQRLRITSLTFLFTDLRGSTELYERVGDLVAFDLVRAHFAVLQEIVANEAGAVVKTIGDAVMATFATPDRAVAAAMRMRGAMDDLNRKAGRDDLVLKIGLHEGPCIAVALNERQDYFGQTVNIAARVQGLADTQSVFATGQVVGDARAARLLEEMHLTAVPQAVHLRGVARDIAVYAVG
jgi:class 3 adenylate cyclase